MEDEVKYWKSAHEAKVKEYNDLQSIYKEFQASSQEFESELEIELSQAHTENERIRSKLSKAESQVRKLREELERSRVQANSEIASLQKKIVANGAQSEIEQALLKLEQQKNELEKRSGQQVREFQDRIDALQEQNEILQTELEELAASNVENTQQLKAQLREAQAELVMAMEQSGGDGDAAKSERYSSLLNELKEEIKELNTMVETLTEEKVQLEARLLEESELNEELTAEVSDLTDDFMANSDKIEDLENKLRTAQEQLALSTAQNRRLSSTGTSLVGVIPPAAKPEEPKPAPAPVAPAPAPAPVAPAPAPAAPVASPAASKEPTASEKAMKDRLQLADIQLKTLQEEKKMLSEKLKVQSDLAADLTIEVNNLTEERDNAIRKLAIYEKDSDEVQEKVNLAAELEAKVKQLQGEVREAARKVAEADSIVAETKAELEKANQALREQAKGGSLSLQTLVKDRDELAARIGELEEENNGLKNQLADAKAQTDSVLAERQAEKENLERVRAEQKQRSAAVAAQLQSAMAAGGKNPRAARLAQCSVTVSSLRTSMEGVSAELSSTATAMSSTFQKIKSAVSSLSTIVTSTEHNYRQEADERRKLFDQLQDMKGNIRVFCRVRPLMPRERDENVEDCAEFPADGQISILRKGQAGDIKPETFTFDRVFGALTTQTDIYKDVEPLVLSVMDGYNVCIFAYGQTGSGKTFTMEGPPGQRGINFRSLASIFKRVKALSPQWQFKVTVSLMEIYNERLHDLLDLNELMNLKNREADSEDVPPPAENDDKGVGDGKIKIRKGPNGVYVEGATKVHVHSAEEVLEVIATGAKNRTTFATNANEHSSRSHSILMVDVDGFDQVSNNKVSGKMFLVDLAGSERVNETKSSGQRLVEATYINKSLSALGDVMNALSDPKKPKFVPYRNSKLTYLLQDALGGNSKTMMFVNCSPCDKHAQETICSLQFARRVRTVRLSPTAAAEIATLNKYKSQIDDVNDQRKQAEQKLARTVSKYEEKIKEKEDLIFELSERLKSSTAKVNQVELSKKKELADLLDKTARQSKQNDVKEERNKLMKKQQQLEEKLEQMQNLLKLSQRENKALKDAAEDKAKKTEVGGDPSKTKVLEAKIEELTRKAREEALKRKKLEDGTENASRAVVKQLEDKEQIIRLLRDKNRKLEHELQIVKTSVKKLEVTALASGADVVPTAPRRTAKLARSPSNLDDDARSLTGVAPYRKQSTDSNMSDALQAGIDEAKSRPPIAGSGSVRRATARASPNATDGSSKVPRSAPGSREPSVVNQRARQSARDLIAKRRAEAAAAAGGATPAPAGDKPRFQV